MVWAYYICMDPNDFELIDSFNFYTIQIAWLVVYVTGIFVVI